MKLRVLGCSGGVGQGLFTTSFMVDDNLLIDCGSGVGNLSLDQFVAIEHVFLTHSHLDHIGFLPLLIDSVFERIRERGIPLTIHGSPETLNALRAHIFNGVIWPDFAQLPSAETPVMKYREMNAGEVYELDGKRFEMIPVDHIVPSAAFRVSTDKAAFAFSSDTGPNQTLWNALNAHARLDLLIVETAFPDSMSDLGRVAKHYCPQTLAEDLRQLRHQPDIYITHLKPAWEDVVFAELLERIKNRKIHRLFGGELFELDAS